MGALIRDHRARTKVKKETVMMTTRVELTPAQQQVIDQVRALRAYTTTTGFKTTRSQNDLLQALNGTDLATVLVALNTK
jgi:hypothetical protein